MKMGVLFFLVFGCLLVVFLWVFSFFWSLAVFCLFFAVFCLCFCLGPALLEGSVFETLSHDNGSSLSSGVWLSFGCFS